MEDDIAQLKEAVEALTGRLDAHIEKVEPILEGLAASKAFVKFITWAGGFIIGVGAIYTMAKQVFHI